jgi:ATP-dependent Lhr-like helicase
MPLSPFHPAVARWFSQCFDAPTEPQQRTWPAIRSGQDTLLAAPTGSGKTLAAFLSAIDTLLREGLDGRLDDTTRVVYVSPLKALSNDIHRNLEWPLAGIRDRLLEGGQADVDIRVTVRTGDTTPGERAAMVKHPPHILVTTPESLYLLLTSESGRNMLAGVRTVIVDEIHAIAGSKRGSHLALSLERLTALVGGHLQRIGLSATQKPIEEIACFLTGNASPDACTIIDSGHLRDRDLALELPGAPLEAVMSAEVWEMVYDRLAALADQHRTTLIFVNTRRLAERVTRHLSERIGRDSVAAHHGSLSKGIRLDAEQRLKKGALRALVATASLELGIDIGDVDLVCQIGTPRAIATFLQRVGRSGHGPAGLPRGRLFPLSRDELVECTALLDSVRRGELDRLIIPDKPLDVLAQQLVAEVAAREWGEDELYRLVRRGWPYRALTRGEFDQVVRMLADGFATRRGRRSAWLHRDAVNRRLRGRDGARLTALTCGGAIPDNADYRVVLEPADTFIGTVNEDFAIESMAGDIFQLGNASYRILRVESGQVRVEDARGAPPTIPFWIGEAPGRTPELSHAVARLRADLDRRLTDINTRTLETVQQYLVHELQLDAPAAAQLTEYLAAAKGMLGLLPTQQTLVFERFFDETGGQQLVIHAPLGSRVNRAWGLALRKRFCRKFNFELQAAATEDAIILSLGETHSFALEDVARYLNSQTVRKLLVQALLDAPMFAARWRWVSNIALAVRRFRGGKKNPPQLQRIEAEDLMAVVFPDGLACFENIQGEREVPDHPLVNQAIHDCLTEAMDIEGLERLLASLERGDTRVVVRDLPHPSPLAQEILTARPYAFLDDAPLEERRTQAVLGRRWLDPAEAADFGRLDLEAIERVRAEAWPQADSADELHDALMLLGAVTADEGRAHRWQDLLAELIAARRATRLHLDNGPVMWVAAEALPQALACWPQASLDPVIQTPAEYTERHWSTADAQQELLRGRLQGSGPVTAAHLSELLAVDPGAVDSALTALETEGFAMRGQFTPDSPSAEWCERRLLARIHRYTVERLRAEIEPVSVADFMRFLLAWHGLTAEPKPEGAQALAAVVESLEGFEAPAVAWEADILPARLHNYAPEWLDNLCRAGKTTWMRLTLPRATSGKERAATPLRTTPISLLSRRNLATWRAASAVGAATPGLSSRAEKVAQFLSEHGASFFDEIAGGAGLLKTQAEEALGELVALGLAVADSYSGLRALLLPASKRSGYRGRRRHLAEFGLEEAGRWAGLQRPASDGRETQPAEAIEAIARTLLQRYGVVFKRLLEREADWLPSWYELLRVYRRLEARGEIRGGRFVAGPSGEQYALPEVVGVLRATRKTPKDGKLVSVSAADPLNLTGTLLPGNRVPSLAGNRVLFRDGVPVAAQVASETRFLEPLAPEQEWELRSALIRQPVPPGVRLYLN